MKDINSEYKSRGSIWLCGNRSRESGREAGRMVGVRQVVHVPKPRQPHDFMNNGKYEVFVFI